MLPTTFPTGPKYTMKSPIGGAEMSKNNCSPGPGAYHPNQKGDGPSYSLGSRTNTLPDNSKNPGPGNYNISTNKNLVKPSYVFGTEPKTSLSNLNIPTNVPKWNKDPGPGQYAPNDNYVNTSHPKYSFGTSSRLEPLNNTNPGPGEYKLRPKFGNEGPVSTMHGPQNT